MNLAWLLFHRIIKASQYSLIATLRNGNLKRKTSDHLIMNSIELTPLLNSWEKSSRYCFSLLKYWVRCAWNKDLAIFSWFCFVVTETYVLGLRGFWTIPPLVYRVEEQCKVVPWVALIPNSVNLLNLETHTWRTRRHMAAALIISQWLGEEGSGKNESNKVTI